MRILTHLNHQLRHPNDQLRHLSGRSNGHLNRHHLNGQLYAPATRRGDLPAWTS
ncbi:hypothetical protein AB0E69_23295 [Kribbella sp. NPDC026611]|uniref:hypothetical protein n=1 Tax=Kribbella sp. NPDC026611 TaxID=3154911 RepID=UPI0033DF1740